MEIAFVKVDGQWFKNEVKSTAITAGHGSQPRFSNDRSQWLHCPVQEIPWMVVSRSRQVANHFMKDTKDVLIYWSVDETVVDIIDHVFKYGTHFAMPPTKRSREKQGTASDSSAAASRPPRRDRQKTSKKKKATDKPKRKKQAVAKKTAKVMGVATARTGDTTRSAAPLAAAAAAGAGKTASQVVPAVAQPVIVHVTTHYVPLVVSMPRTTLTGRPMSLLIPLPFQQPLPSIPGCSVLTKPLLIYLNFLCEQMKRALVDTQNPDYLPALETQMDLNFSVLYYHFIHLLFPVTNPTIPLFSRDYKNILNMLMDDCSSAIDILLIHYPAFTINYLNLKVMFIFTKFLLNASTDYTWNALKLCFPGADQDVIAQTLRAGAWFSSQGALDVDVIQRYRCAIERCLILMKRLPATYSAPLHDLLSVYAISGTASNPLLILDGPAACKFLAVLTPPAAVASAQATGAAAAASQRTPVVPLGFNVARLAAARTAGGGGSGRPPASNALPGPGPAVLR
jgi:hypothetical protein